MNSLFKHPHLWHEDQSILLYVCVITFVSGRCSCFDYKSSQTCFYFFGVNTSNDGCNLMSVPAPPEGVVPLGKCRCSEDGTKSWDVPRSRSRTLCSDCVHLSTMLCSVKARHEAQDQFEGTFEQQKVPDLYQITSYECAPSSPGPNYQTGGHKARGAHSAVRHTD